MKISVVTIAYQSAATIESTVQSVLAQDYAQKEYILIDGASTDGTLDIVNRYQPQIDVVISEKDNGIYDAMNKGIKAATGDVVGILNSDDFYAHPHVISRVASVFEQQQCDAVYADLRYVHRDNTSRTVRTWRAGAYKPGWFRQGWMPPHPTFFVKKKCYDELGLYNTALRSAADYELMLRFIEKHRISVAYLPEVIIHMRTGGQSNASLRNRLRANMEDREAWRMNGLVPAWYTLTWKPLRKLGQYLRH